MKIEFTFCRHTARSDFMITSIYLFEIERILKEIVYLK